MAEIELVMLPVRERAHSTCSVRVYQTSLVRPSQQPLTAFKTYGVESYVPVGATVVRAADAPVSASVTVSVGNAGGIHEPWLPEHYVYRSVKPSMRWVARAGSFSYRDDGTISEWFALPGPPQIRPLKGQGRAQHLRSTGVSLPQFAYRAAAGLRSVDAVSLTSYASMTMQVETSRGRQVAAAAVGTFDRSADLMYEAVSLVTSEQIKVAIGVDVDGTLALVIAGEIVGSIPNPFAPGRLMGLTISTDRGMVRGGVHTVDGVERTMTGSISEYGAPWVDRLVVGGSSQDAEVVEVALWYEMDHEALRDQMTELLAYYNSRSMS